MQAKNPRVLLPKKINQIASLASKKGQILPFFIAFFIDSLCLCHFFTQQPFGVHIAIDHHNNDDIH